ncbi:hypothetical protein V8C43DRAFT_118170 [Trichoderma afarasin]
MLLQGTSMQLQNIFTVIDIWNQKALWLPLDEAPPLSVKLLRHHRARDEGSRRSGASQRVEHSEWTQNHKLLTNSKARYDLHASVCKYTPVARQGARAAPFLLARTGHGMVASWNDIVLALAFFWHMLSWLSHGNADQISTDSIGSPRACTELRRLRWERMANRFKDCSLL